MAGQTDSKALLNSSDAALHRGEFDLSKKGVSEVVMGTPVPQKWSTGLFDCCTTEDPAYNSTDCEICCLGWIAPCVLYGSTRERLHRSTAQYSDNCWLYFGLYCVGKVLCKSNVLAPCISWRTRTDIRTQLGLQGDAKSYTAVSDALCCRRSVPGGESEECQRRCDCALHYFCHPCALCQEAREVRRRLPHPTLAAAAPAGALLPPSQQAFSA